MTSLHKYCCINEQRTSSTSSNVKVIFVPLEEFIIQDLKSMDFKVFVYGHYMLFSLDFSFLIKK